MGVVGWGHWPGAHTAHWFLSLLWLLRLEIFKTFDPTCLDKGAVLHCSKVEFWAKKTFEKSLLLWQSTNQMKIEWHPLGNGGKGRKAPWDNAFEIKSLFHLMWEGHRLQLVVATILYHLVPKWAFELWNLKYESFFFKTSFKRITLQERRSFFWAWTNIKGEVRQKKIIDPKFLSQPN